MITREDILDFTTGACFLLAAEIERQAGLPCAAMWDGYRACGHVFNVLPGKLFLDIEGVHTRAEIMRRWGTATKRHGRRGITRNVRLHMWAYYGDREGMEARAAQLAPEVLALAAHLLPPVLVPSA